jgi:hypothetical protein
MALGGGKWVTQTKDLPGTYINFVSAKAAAPLLGERGFVALGIELDWGITGEIFTLTADQFARGTSPLLGVPMAHPSMQPLRELFKGAQTAFLYRLNGGGVKAACTFGTAKYAGTRGNAISLVVEESEGFVASTNEVYSVTVLVDGAAQFFQSNVKALSELTECDWIDWITTASIAPTAGMNLTGGTNSTVTNGDYQAFLDAAEGYSFNVIACQSTDPIVKGLFTEYTIRLRDELGVKFQCVLHRHTVADHPGVISVENGTDAGLVYWVAGMTAGCLVGGSNLNALYTGELDVEVARTQQALADGIRAGKFLLHRVGTNIRVLEDINTFTSFTEDQGEDFAQNQVIRVLDGIGIYIAGVFNGKYLGAVPNDNAGRISLWADILSFLKALVSARAIDAVDPNSLTVGRGERKGSVVVRLPVSPNSAMRQLYCTVIVE